MEEVRVSSLVEASIETLWERIGTAKESTTSSVRG